jgi:hypothetical protein
LDGIALMSKGPAHSSTHLPFILYKRAFGRFLDINGLKKRNQGAVTSDSVMPGITVSVNSSVWVKLGLDTCLAWVLYL